MNAIGWIRVAALVAAVDLGLGVGCGSGQKESTGRVAQAFVTFLWASPNGSGTLCTQASPCSLTQAQSAVRAVNANMVDDIIVSLLDGTYTLSAPLTFGPSDSGNNGHSVIWTAASNATPVISGGTQITGWSASPRQAGLYQASVGGLNTRQLYVNGVRMPRAGGKPSVTLSQTTAGFTSSDATMASWGNQGNIEFEFSGTSSANGHHWTDSRCPVANIVGTTITMAQPCWGNLTVDGGIPWFGAAGGPPTRIDNAFELLDEPGEWYLDRSTGTLYYFPLSGQNMTSATVIAPTLESLLVARGTLDAPVRSLRFVGLTFAYATWLRPGTPTGFAEMQANFTQTGAAGDGRQGGCTTINPDGSCPCGSGACPFGAWTKTPAAVTFHAVQTSELLGDTFVHLGGAGVGLEYGSSSNSVTDCIFTDISATGIQVGGTDDPRPTDARATVSNSTVNRNYIHDLPTEYLGGVGIFVGYTANVSILNNLIANTPYSGMSIGWGGWIRTPQDPDPPLLLNASRNNVVSNNHIFNVLQTLFDGGPLYSNGNRGTQFSDGDVYSGNHFHDQFHYGHGVYDDIGSRFITIGGQVVYNVPDAWGGCAASGDLVFQNGFWSPAPPPGAGFGCNPPPTTNVTSSNNVALAAPDPAADCEANSTCAGTIAAAGPQGSDPLLEIVDGRGETVLVDDPPDVALTYTGSWAHDTNRGTPINDIASTLSYTTVNGDSFQFSFTGSGVDYIAELDSNRGNVAISVDGVAYPNANCWGQLLVSNQVCGRVRGLGRGTHVLRGVKLDGTYMSVDALRVYTDGPHGRPLDDTDPAVTYTGSSWNPVQRSTYGEYDSTLHYATANGDSYTVAFTGTGAALFGDRDPFRGSADVTLDGVFVQSINAYAPSVASQQQVFSVHGLAQGAHTLSVTKRSGTYLDIDRVDVNSTTLINDDDLSVIMYSGSGWVDSENRPYGDYNADVYYTTVDGDSAAFTFTGSGVDVIAETNTDRGMVDVRVDGVPRGRIFSYSYALGVQQTVYRLHGLARDTHQIVLTKRGGTYMTVDAFRVFE